MSVFLLAVYAIDYHFNRVNASLENRVLALDKAAIIY
jgi:hypothetical protein